jgi:hypothetical protein
MTASARQNGIGFSVATAGCAFHDPFADMPGG